MNELKDMGILQIIEEFYPLLSELEKRVLTVGEKRLILIIENALTLLADKQD